MAKKLKAVVVDDLDFCRELLTEVLQMRGYEVASYAQAEAVPFCSGEGGRCRTDAACADLLLTDNRMPGLTGLQMLEKQQARGCKLCQRHPALLSSCLTHEELSKANSLGCQVFEKPFDLGRLSAWLDACERSILFS